MANQMDKEKYKAVVRRCKQQRAAGTCERQCFHWHPMLKSSPSFCKQSLGNDKNVSNNYRNN